MNNFIKLCFVKYLLLCPFTGHSQKISISDSIAVLCEKIAKDSVIESRYISSFAFPSDQWERFNSLNLIASDSNLFLLVKHSSPAVRGYAYLGLMSKNPEMFMKALRENESDSSLVKTLNGCIGGMDQVYIYAVKNAYYFFNEESKSKLLKEDYDYLKTVYLEYQKKQMELFKSKRKNTQTKSE